MAKKRTVVVTWRTDEGCEMAEVLVNGQSVGYGNMWDFHPDDSVAMLKSALEVLDIDYEIVTDDDWKCGNCDESEEDDG